VATSSINATICRCLQADNFLQARLSVVIASGMVSTGMLQMMQAKSLLDSAAMAEAGKGGANEQAALALTK